MPRMSRHPATMAIKKEEKNLPFIFRNRLCSNKPQDKRQEVLWSNRIPEPIFSFLFFLLSSSFCYPPFSPHFSLPSFTYFLLFSILSIFHFFLFLLCVYSFPCDVSSPSVFSIYFRSFCKFSPWTLLFLQHVSLPPPVSLSNSFSFSWVSSLCIFPPCLSFYPSLVIPILSGCLTSLLYHPSIFLFHSPFPTFFLTFFNSISIYNNLYIYIYTYI